MTPKDRWVADPSIGWRILLTATLEPAPDEALLAARFMALAESQGWGAPPAVVSAASTPDLQQALVSAHPAPVVVGTAGRDLVISAHHGRVDGLGLLQVLAGLTGAPASSSARGVGDRPTTGSVVGTTLRRLVEVGLRPPARVARGVARPAAGDVLVEREVPGRWRSADLVHAATQGLLEYGAPGRLRRVAVAVGATREPLGADPDMIADRSVLLRLRDVERLDRAQIAAALTAAPVQTPPRAPEGRAGAVLDRAASAALRALAPRLGSTMLVSHLGDVTTAATRLAFAPVTAGGSGLSLGAVSVVADSPTTVLTLRARAAAWDADGLERLLEAVVGRLE